MGLFTIRNALVRGFDNTDHLLCCCSVSGVLLSSLSLPAALDPWCYTLNTHVASDQFFRNDTNNSYYHVSSQASVSSLTWRRSLLLWRNCYLSWANRPVDGDRDLTLILIVTWLWHSSQTLQSAREPAEDKGLSTEKRTENAQQSPASNRQGSSPNSEVTAAKTHTNTCIHTHTCTHTHTCPLSRPSST